MATWEEYEEEIEEMVDRNLQMLNDETPEEQAKARQLLKGFLKENEADPSRGISSSPRDLVEDVMQRHGFTREEAIEMIEAFGG